MLYRVGTQTMIDLAYALAFALLMLIPISDSAVLGGVLLVLSVGGALLTTSSSFMPLPPKGSRKRKGEHSDSIRPEGVPGRPSQTESHNSLSSSNYGSAVW